MNVKSGDLAIIKDAVNRSNIGKVVEVGTYLGDTPAGLNMWLIHGHQLKTGLGVRTYAYAPDSTLQKISGLEPVIEEETIIDKVLAFIE